MDTNLVLRSGASTFTQDETLPTLRVGPMDKPLWLHVLVPAVSAGEVLDVELEFCAAAADTTQVYNMNMAQITAAGFFSVPFFTKLEYVQVKLNITGNGGEDLGAVKVWVDNAHRSDSPMDS